MDFFQNICHRCEEFLSYGGGIANYSSINRDRQKKMILKKFHLIKTIGSWGGMALCSLFCCFFVPCHGIYCKRCSVTCQINITIFPAVEEVNIRYKCGTQAQFTPLPLVSRCVQYTLWCMGKPRLSVLRLLLVTSKEWENRLECVGK